jgi:hypothetical protein
VVDKRKENDLPAEDSYLDDEDQNQNLVGSNRNLAVSQLRNKKNQTQDIELDQKLEDLRTEAWSQESVFQRDSLVQPYDKNFSLDDLPDADMDFEDGLEAGCYRDGGKSRGLGKAATAATIAGGAIGAVAIGERQKVFHSVLPDVEKTTGVPARLVGAFWGNESGFGKNLVSPTNCLGDGQFTRRTWAAMIKQYGDRIPGMEQYAADLRSGKIQGNDPELQKMRMDPKASAYAMGFYINEVARELKVDPKDEKNWGVIYAGYNVGPGNARKLVNNQDSNTSAMNMLGDVAKNNPMFYDKGRATPAQAVANYNVVILQSAKNFDQKVAAKLGTDTVVARADTKQEPISAASAVSASTITTSAKPAKEFGDPKAKAEAEKVAMASMSIIDKIKAKITTFSYGYGEATNDPVYKVAEADKPKAPISKVYGEPPVVAEKNKPAANVPMYHMVG